MKITNSCFCFYYLILLFDGFHKYIYIYIYSDYSFHIISYILPLNVNPAASYQSCSQIHNACFLFCYLFSLANAICEVSVGVLWVICEYTSEDIDFPSPWRYQQQTAHHWEGQLFESRLSEGCYFYYEQKQTWKERVYLTFDSTWLFIIEESRDRKSKRAGTWKQELMQRMEKCFILACSSWPAF